MQDRRLRLAAVTSLVLVVAAVVPAVAATPRNATLTVKGGTVFKPNRFIGDGMRFGKDVTTIKSGGTLTIRDKTREPQPHSFSIVKSSELPRTAGQAERCRVCQKLGQAHGAPENGEGPPTIPLVDKGAKGFNQAGDSLFFAGRSAKLRITAKAGRTLSFVCAIHPWMQGKIAVRK